MDILSLLRVQIEENLILNRLHMSVGMTTTADAGTSPLSLRLPTLLSIRAILLAGREEVLRHSAGKMARLCSCVEAVDAVPSEAAGFSHVAQKDGGCARELSVGAAAC